ncbi:unnamed protein product [Adineta steineri]|uniref:Uncharacterized protein n=1 Tax=Adineta steineri TaxID=433720 RepID=A0A815PXA9_9BILA|nr:unnamed protein product [Adineta steineri]CAF1455637.1 unnamed protein product [Adineta steineri]
MSLFTSTINEVLPFMPVEIHGKTIEIFNRIPGTLLKYFDPKAITKKAECGEHNFNNAKTIGNDKADIDSRDTHKDTSDLPSKKSYNTEGTQRSLSLRAKSSSKYGSEKDTAFNSDLWFSTHGFDNGKDYSNLRTQLRDSIKKMFRERNITEISPSKIAREIATKCLEQCPNWGKQHQNTSAIVRFNSTYITDDPLVKMNIHAYVYAHLVCEHESSFMFRHSYKNSFDLTIEVNGISIDPIKISQFIRLVTENSVSDSVKAIEGIAPLTWDDLNGPHTTRNTEKKLALTWDDI